MTDGTKLKSFFGIVTDVVADAVSATNGAEVVQLMKTLESFVLPESRVLQERSPEMAHDRIDLQIGF